ncbi:MAG: hypothetical protein A2V87_01725 [Deltaproteobacteria bacterium RBG_16_58_17]|nr:MAG: hypothetical protein A2V87_01725 [Deltaproteobacteria bacterium RBG_16_58_17]OHE18316.1 MAG: hypothetical protein A2X96_12715 [Syntrophobacterales bacterium GWC2_56_13]
MIHLMHCALFHPEIEPDVRVIGGCDCKLAAYVIPSDPANHRIPLNLGALGVIQFKDQFNPVALIKGRFVRGKQAATAERKIDNSHPFEITGGNQLRI